MMALRKFDWLDPRIDEFVRGLLTPDKNGEWTLYNYCSAFSATKFKEVADASLEEIHMLWHIWARQPGNLESRLWRPAKIKTHLPKPKGKSHAKTRSKPGKPYTRVQS
jgi:hypothetical protein